MDYFVNGIRLHVLETGNGPQTLVFLHYFGGSAREWQGVMEQLSPHYRCMAVDLRGHGDSEAPASGYAVASMADDVLALIRASNSQDFTLVGHSMGGKVALAVASRQPAGLRSMVLIAPSPPLPEPIPEADRVTMLQTHGQRSAAEETFANITEKPLSETARQQIIADNLRTASVAWNAWLLLGSKEDISEQMSLIRVPIAIMAGQADRALSPAVQPALTLPYLPNATLKTVEAAGHLLPWEIPHEVADFIRAYVQG